MKPIHRTNCVICGHSHLEPLYTFKDFPVFMGCTTEPPETDLRMDMSWAICPECGTIQLDKLVPLEILYQENHNEAVGGVWQEHHTQFAEFILEHGGENRLEIGGANGKVAQLARERSQSGRWLILEPNLFDGTPEIPNTEFERGWFEENYQPPFEVDTVIHSHVIEHLYEPCKTLAQVSTLLKVGDKTIFSLPNMKVWLQKKYTNCLMFEHTYYLPEDVIEFMMGVNGFKVTAKKYFREHSIFFACEKIGDSGVESLQSPRNYHETKALFQSFIEHYTNVVKEIDDRVSSYPGALYIFGAHIFTLYLLGFGLKEDYFLNILDNAPAKIGKRLYGTQLMVKSPKCLKDMGEALVVLKAGAYTEEIKQDILVNINSKILFC